MIAQPVPMLSNRQDKKIPFENLAHQLIPITLFGCERSKNSLTKFGVEFLREGGLQEELLQIGRLLIEYLLTEEVELVHAGHARRTRFICQCGEDVRADELQAGYPAFRGGLQFTGLFRRNADVIAMSQQGLN